MKAILRVKEVVEYERLYEIECNEDIEDREELVMLLNTVNATLKSDLKNGQMAYGADNEAEVFCSVFKNWKTVGEHGEVKSDEISTYIAIPDCVSLVREGEEKCEI